MPRTSSHGNKWGEEGSVLLDAVVAVFIVALGISAAALAVNTIAHRKPGRIDSTVQAIGERGDKELKVFAPEP